MATYYDILNLDKGASPAAITNAYGKLAVEYHPDKNQDNLLEAQRKYKLIREAYIVLSNPEKRAIYNALLPSTDGTYEPGKTRYFESRPFIVNLAQHTGLNEHFINELFYEDKVRFNNLNRLQAYISHCALTQEGALHQIETLQEILNVNQKEAANLLAAQSFVGAGLMTIAEAKALSEEERTILSANSDNHKTMQDKIHQLQAYRVEHSSY